MSSTSYRDRVNEWRKEREENLRKENGWLALYGLFWLKPGLNVVGSAQESAVRLPDRFPALIGHFDWNDEAVIFHPDLEINEFVEAFSGLEPKLSSDMEPTPTFINFEKISMVLIKRGNRFGIRMWDNSRSERMEHPPRTWYEIDETYRLPAFYLPFNKPTAINFPEVSGEFQDLAVAGTISFEYMNRSYDLIVSLEDDGTLFLRFWDESSKSISYPSGRYIVLDPAINNHLELDFNFSYNPPCAFTPYATCVFAPKQNRLDFSVFAGESFLQDRINESH
jgi:hypothetical protein